jgi:hypothetical protein
MLFIRSLAIFRCADITIPLQLIMLGASVLDATSSDDKNALSNPPPAITTSSTSSASTAASPAEEVATKDINSDDRYQPVDSVGGGSADGDDSHALLNARDVYGSSSSSSITPPTVAAFTPMQSTSTPVSSAVNGLDFPIGVDEVMNATSSSSSVSSIRRERSSSRQSTSFSVQATPLLSATPSSSSSSSSPTAVAETPKAMKVPAPTPRFPMLTLPPAMDPDFPFDINEAMNSCQSISLPKSWRAELARSRSNTLDEADFNVQMSTSSQQQQHQSHHHHRHFQYQPKADPFPHLHAPTDLSARAHQQEVASGQHLLVAMNDHGEIIVSPPPNRPKASAKLSPASVNGHGNGNGDVFESPTPIMMKQSNRPLPSHRPAQAPKALNLSTKSTSALPPRSRPAATVQSSSSSSVAIKLSAPAIATSTVSVSSPSSSSSSTSSSSTSASTVLTIPSSSFDAVAAAVPATGLVKLYRDMLGTLKLCPWPIILTSLVIRQVVMPLFGLLVMQVHVIDFFRNIFCCL